MLLLLLFVLEPLLHDLTQRLRVRPWYRVAHGGGRTVLEWAGRAVVFEGRATARLLPALLDLLDGEHRLDDVVRTLGEPARPAVLAAVATLERHGLVEAAPAPLPGAAPAAETCRALASVSGRHTAEDECARRLAAATVAVAGAGAAAAELAGLLALSGVGTVARVDAADAFAEPAALAVVAPSSAELPVLRGLNGEALGLGRPWLQLLPHDGELSVVGPLFLPGETCCRECYVRLRAANAGLVEELDVLAEAPAAYPAFAAVDRAAAALAAVDVLRWLVDADPSLPGAILAIDVLAGRVTRHAVLRLPRCPACSPAASLAPPAPWHESVA